MSKAMHGRTLPTLSPKELNTQVNHEPRLYDLRLAERLGFERPRDIRKMIERNRAELEGYGEICATVAQNTDPRGRGRPGTEYYLNEGQSLLLCMFSRTEKAAEVRKEVIEVYMAYRIDNGGLGAESRPVLDPPIFEPPVLDMAACDPAQREEFSIACHGQRLRVVVFEGVAWFSSHDVAALLGMPQTETLGRLYRRHARGFTTATSRLMRVRVGGHVAPTITRMFSPCGVHELALFYLDQRREMGFRAFPPAALLKNPAAVFGWLQATVPASPWVANAGGMADGAEVWEKPALKPQHAPIKAETAEIEVVPGVVHLLDLRYSARPAGGLAVVICPRDGLILAYGVMPEAALPGRLDPAQKRNVSRPIAPVAPDAKSRMGCKLVGWVRGVKDAASGASSGAALPAYKAEGSRYD